jgi:hypothetical protein
VQRLECYEFPCAFLNISETSSPKGVVLFIGYIIGSHMVQKISSDECFAGYKHGLHQIIWGRRGNASDF